MEFWQGHKYSAHRGADQHSLAYREKPAVDIAMTLAKPKKVLIEIIQVIHSTAGVRFINE